MASYKQLPDKSWQVRLSWVENGKRRQKLKRGFKRKSEAQIFATEFQKNIIDGISPLQKDTPFAEYFGNGTTHSNVNNLPSVHKNATKISDILSKNTSKTEKFLRLIV